MKKQLTERQKMIHARNKKMGPAMIEHPLRFIKARATVSGYITALEAASRGDGAFVKAMALTVLRYWY